MARRLTTPERIGALYRQICRCGIVVVTLTAVFISASPSAYAVFDDFSDGTDGSAGTPTNPTPSPLNVSGPVWNRLDGLAISTGQTWDASTEAYHMTAENNGYDGYGEVGAYVATSFTDVKVTADFVSFGGPGLNPAFGVLARSNGGNGNFADDQNTLKGYGYIYEPYAAGLTGEIVFYRFVTFAEGVFDDISAQQLTLDPNKDYRFSLEIIGNQLHGQVFEIGGGTVSEAFVTDNTYTSGYSGILSISQEDPAIPGMEPSPNFTVDNFSSEDVVSLVGDYNGNGKVDAADYVLWRDNPDGFGGSPAGYDAWRAHFGNPPGSGAGLGDGSAVPEPVGGLLILLGTIFLNMATRRSRG